MAGLPDFIIIGAMKSATSSLQAQLDLQPGIFMTTPKEPNFFSDEAQFAKGVDWYRTLFHTAPAASLCGEASTHYSKLPNYPNTVQRLDAIAPKAKFIYVMRHPIDRLISHYVHEWSARNLSCDLEQAIDSYPELVDYGLYARQLQPYFKTFGKASVCPVFFDRLVGQPQLEFERICRFIGYRGNPHWQSKLSPSNVSRVRIRRFPLYGILIESAIASYLRRALIPPSLRERIKTRLRMEHKPEINQATAETLHRRFNEDLSILGGWLGIELNCDNFKRQTGRDSLEWSSSHG